MTECGDKTYRPFEHALKAFRVLLWVTEHQVCCKRLGAVAAAAAPVVLRRTLCFFVASA
jgi:hypothetical protein